MFEPLALFNTLVTLGLIIGGLLAYRHGFAHTVSEVQERVITALQTEIQTLHDRIAALEEENTRLHAIISTLYASLKRRGIHVTVDGDAVSILERADGSCSCAAHKQDEQDERHGEEARDSNAAPAPTLQKRRRTVKRAPQAQGEA